MFRLSRGLCFITTKWIAVTQSDICGTLGRCSGKLKAKNAIWLNWSSVTVPATSAAPLFTEGVSANKVHLADKQPVMLSGQKSDSWTLDVTMEIQSISPISWDWGRLLSFFCVFYCFLSQQVLSVNPFCVLLFVFLNNIFAFFAPNA